MELSKREKKIARQLIETGLQREFAEGISAIDAIVQDWKRQAPSDHKATYHLLYKTLIDFDKHIARRYDNMSGSKYFFIVVDQVLDGVLPETELDCFSPETRQKIFGYLKMAQEQ